MALPKLNTPTFGLILPSSGKRITFRPFVVKEEKTLLMAAQSDDPNDMIDAVKSTIASCVLDKSVSIDTAICFNQRNKIKYYYYSGSTTCCQEPYYPLTGQINPPVLLNGTLVSENDFNKINAANKNSNCLPEPPELDSLKANPVIDLKVRPNPSSESFEINFENKSHLEYSIYTIQGLKVENGTVSNGQTIGVELKHGLYLLVVKNTEGTFPQTIKIIKL